MSQNIYQWPAFSDLGWIHDWFECFAPGSQVVLGTEDDPLTILKIGNIKIAGIRLRALLSPTNEHSPRYGWFFSEKPAQKVRELLRESMKEHNVDVLELDFIPEDSISCTFFKGLAMQAGWAVEIQPWHETAVINLRQPEDEYFAKLSKKIKTNANRAENGLKRIGDLSYFDAAKLPDWQEWLQRVFELEAKGWKGEQGSAIIQRKHEQAFYENIVSRTHEQGGLRLYVLVLNGELIAFNLLVLWDETYFGLKTGYLESYSKYSPGNILQRFVLKELFSEEKAGKLDMLDPVTPWKAKWCADKELLYRVRVYSPAFKSRLAFYLRKILRFAKRQWVKVKHG